MRLPAFRLKVPLSRIRVETEKPERRPYLLLVLGQRCVAVAPEAAFQLALILRADTPLTPTSGALLDVVLVLVIDLLQSYLELLIMLS